MTIDVQESPIIVIDDTRRDILDVGIDTGNGRTHLCGDRRDGQGGQIEYTMPSAMSLFSPTSDQLLTTRGAGPGMWDRLSSEEHLVVFPGSEVERAVGELALLLATDRRYPVTTGSGDDERYASLGLKLALTALARTYQPAAKEELKVRVSTGLPVALWTPARRDAVIAAWKGRHTITYRGTTMVIHLVDVQVRAEGHAAWVTLPAEQKVGTTLLIDIGARTAIATLMQDGIAMQAIQMELGVDPVLDQLDAQLQRSGNRALNLYERFALLADLAASPPRAYAYVDGGKRVSLDSTAKALFAQAGAQLIDHLAAVVNYTRVEHTVISGGGVLFIGQAAAAAYKARVGKEPTLLSEPAVRTARGYYEQLSLKSATPKKKGRR